MPNITKRKKHRLELTFQPAMFEQYKNAAESVGISVQSWLKMAAASYYSKWATPTQSRKRKRLPGADTEGMLCVVCGGSAEACRNPGNHKASLWEVE